MLLSARTVLTLVVSASLVVLAGCGPTEAQLRTRAAFDMQCPAQELQVQELARFTRGVTGCNKRGTYTVNAGTGEWVLNNSEGIDPGGQPSPKH